VGQSDLLLQSVRFRMERVANGRCVPEAAVDSERQLWNAQFAYGLFV